MKIAVLDSKTLGDDIRLDMFKPYGEVREYKMTRPEEVAERIRGCDIAILNKVKLNAENLSEAKDLKLICVTATGFDNIDTVYCREHGIAAANVPGYSTESVALITVTTALALVTHLTEYRRYCASGAYTAGGVQNRLVPVYHEMSSLTWGIVGMGAIGSRVAKTAEALGCRVIACRGRSAAGKGIVDIDTLCREADIITIHTPLNDSTRRLINAERIALMKPSAIVINMARGAVVDEAALCAALKEGRIGAVGADVYDGEPYGEDSPYAGIAGFDNVILTPHMAWGAYEARMRCMEEIALNIEAFLRGERRNRVD